MVRGHKSSEIIRELFKGTASAALRLNKCYIEYNWRGPLSRNRTRNRARTIVLCRVPGAIHSDRLSFLLGRYRAISRRAYRAICVKYSTFATMPGPRTRRATGRAVPRRHRAQFRAAGCSARGDNNDLRPRNSHRNHHAKRRRAKWT
ncbi:unnamed protein product [Colias eurytheme]|nr:unnamed protein product [Colias eurytheme]